MDDIGLDRTLHLELYRGGLGRPWRLAAPGMTAVAVEQTVLTASIRHTIDLLCCVVRSI